MKYDPDTNTVELTNRNLNALRDKLDDPRSARAMGSPCGRIMVRATEDGDRISTDSSEGVVTVTRSELVQLLAGETVTVGDVTVVRVPDSKHYTSRPSGIVVMRSTGEVNGPDMSYWKLRHICEVCGRDQILTPSAAYEAGWDYPPKMGAFGIVGPRTCGSCPMSETVWAALMLNGVAAEDLTDSQRETVARILAEPGSIKVRSEEG